MARASRNRAIGASLADVLEWGQSLNIVGSLYNIYIYIYFYPVYIYRAIQEFSARVKTGSGMLKPNMGGGQNYGPLNLTLNTIGAVL